MPREIKTKAAVKGIKVIDKAASGTAHMKDVFIHSKQSAEATQEQPHNSPGEYATDTVSSHAKGAAHKVTHRFKNGLANPHVKISENISRAKEKFKIARLQLPKQRRQAAEQAKQTAEKAKSTADILKGKVDQAQKTVRNAQKSVTDAKHTLQQTRQVGRQTVQTVKQSEKAIKTVKDTSKGTVKTVHKSVKTAEKTAKATVKTAQQTAKVAQKSAQAAAKSAKLAAQASRASAKAAVQAAKLTGKAVIATVKATIAAIQGLVSLIAAGGWVAVLVILVICLVALIAGSVFGIFFSGEDSGNGRTMPSVVAELTAEINSQVEEIQTQNVYDEVDTGAVIIRWNEVLAVYAVKINTDPDNPAEVFSIDDSSMEILRGVLNDVISLSSYVKTESREQTSADNYGSESTKTATVTILVITLEQKSADEMAAQYGFSQTQIDQLHELLSPEYADLWKQLLGTVYIGSSAYTLTLSESR